MGREKCEKYPKNKRNLLLFGGEIQNLGGEISPPKGPEKNTEFSILVILLASLVPKPNFLCTHPEIVAQCGLDTFNGKTGP